MDLLPYRRANSLRPLLGSGRRLLDLGGGTGRVAQELRADWERVVVADLEPRMLARAHGRGFDCVVADARALPFREGAFDAAVTVDAFHHFPDQPRVLAEVQRALQPGGRAVLEEFDPENWQGRLIERGERLLRFGSRFHPPRDLAAMAEAAGFAARVERFTSRDYALVAERTEGENKGQSPP